MLQPPPFSLDDVTHNPFHRQIDHYFHGVQTKARQIGAKALKNYLKTLREAIKGFNDSNELAILEDEIRDQVKSHLLPHVTGVLAANITGADTKVSDYNEQANIKRADRSIRYGGAIWQAHVSGKRYLGLSASEQREHIEEQRLEFYVRELQLRTEEAADSINSHNWDAYNERCREIEENPESAEWDWDGAVMPEEPYTYSPDPFYFQNMFEDLSKVENLIAFSCGKDGLDWLINHVAEYELQIPEAICEIIDFDAVGIDPDIGRLLLLSPCLLRTYPGSEIQKPGFLADAFIEIIDSLLAGKLDYGADNPFSLSIEYYRKRIEKNYAKLWDLLRDGRLNRLETAFNNAVARGDYHEAQKQWAVFTKFQRLLMSTAEQATARRSPKKNGKDYEFTADDFKGRLKSYDDLLTKAYKKYESRAKDYYHRVLPSPDTEFLTYGSSKPNKVAKMNMLHLLGDLEVLGRQLKAKLVSVSGTANKASTNIVVPVFCFVVSTKPHVKGGDHGRVFVPVTLDLDAYEKYLLSKDEDDGVFDDDSEEYYDLISEDHHHGSTIIFGDPEDDEYRDHILNMSQTNKNNKLHHSERVMFEILRDRDNVRKIIELLEAGLKQQLDVETLMAGEYKVYSLAMFLYSTNSICEYCTVSIVAMQNSHNDGFLHELTDELNHPAEDEKHFKTRGFNAETDQQDADKFRLLTIVSADTPWSTQTKDICVTEESDDYDSTVEDTTEEDSSTSEKSPTYANPKGKLWFPSCSLPMHRSPKPASSADTAPQPKTDFTKNAFVEFVGNRFSEKSSSYIKHVLPVTLNGKACMSGSKASKCYRPEQLDRSVKHTFER